ncbi:class II aldolase/adducin family protein [Inquilinus limosus]|uniref:class II aldolase/adducin family protein n=1 Tax=Inquilinus limosus TaxID=171674 RepID=UPI003F15424E
MTTEIELRTRIVEACRQMNASGLNQGTSGNISARWGDGILVTPTGVPYDEMAPDDIVAMTMDGNWEHGEHRPSSEWRFHLDIHRRKPEVNAVVHCHPMYSTILAIRHMEIPALHYMIACGGGNSIPCAPYATYGTPELSEHAIAALKDRTACLLANHGLIATGPTLGKAMWLAVEVETLAKQYVYSLMLGGPICLPAEEIDRVIEKFKDYGPRPKQAA